jgi:ribosome-associated protein
MDPDEPERIDDAPSKSARKREHRALQGLGSELMALSSAQLGYVPLSEELRQAVAAGRRLKKGARARHVRHLGNLLSRVDAQPIRDAVDGLLQVRARDAARLHRLEAWRERLLADGDEALGELADRYPGLDRQQLRALVRATREEREKGAPPRRFRELLRFLRAVDEEAAD